MLVIIHVLIALSSVAYTTYLYFSPTDTKFKVSYGLVAATLASGTVLIISTHTNMLQACMSGLFYLTAVSFGLVLAKHRYSKEKILK